MLSIWHPVGPHGGETLDAIVNRKLADIEKHGFTLWSFKKMRPERMVQWRDILGGETVQAFCTGADTKDSYRSHVPAPWMTRWSTDSRSWTELEPGRTSYIKSGIAAALYVVGVEHSNEHIARPQRWLRINGVWEETPVPTRGEFIVPTPQPAKQGPVVRLKLHVAFPYVVAVQG